MADVTFPTTFFISAVAYFLLVWGYRIKDYVVIWLGSIMCMGLAIWIATQGVQDYNNFLTVILSSINFALGAYFGLRGIYEFAILKNL